MGHPRHHLVTACDIVNDDLQGPTKGQLAQAEASDKMNRSVAVGALASYIGNYYT